MGEWLKQIQSHQTLHLYHSCKNSWLALLLILLCRKCIMLQTEYPKLDEPDVHISMTRESIHYLVSKHTNIIEINANLTDAFFCCNVLLTFKQIKPSIGTIFVEFYDDTKHRDSYNFTFTCVIDTINVLRSIYGNLSYNTMNALEDCSSLFTIVSQLSNLRITVTIVWYSKIQSSVNRQPKHLLKLQIRIVQWNHLDPNHQKQYLLHSYRAYTRSIYANDKVTDYLDATFCVIPYRNALNGLFMTCRKEHYKEYVMVNQSQSTQEHYASVLPSILGHYSGWKKLQIFGIYIDHLCFCNAVHFYYVLNVFGYRSIDLRF